MIDMTDYYTRILYELRMLEEDLNIQTTELEKATIQYNKDREWDRESADDGYLNQIIGWRKSTMDQIKLLKRLIGSE